MKRETPLVRAILQALQAKRLWAWRVNSGLIIGKYKGKDWPFQGAPAGSPDIFCVLPGGFLAGIECKTADGKLRASQQRWADKAARHGVRYGVARSVGEALALVNGWASEPVAAKGVG